MAKIENNVEIMASANQSKISMAKMAAASMAKISKWRRNGAVISVSEMAKSAAASGESGGSNRL
jgi:hypothetical protein